MPECGNWWQLAAMDAFAALNFSQILWKVVLTQSSYLPMLTLVVVCMALGRFMQHMFQSEQDKVGILPKQRRALLDRSNDNLRHESPRHDSLRHASLRHEALPSLHNEALRRDNVRQHNLRDGLRQETHSRCSAEPFEQREKSYRKSGLHRRCGPRQYQGNESAQILAPLARRLLYAKSKAQHLSMAEKLDAFTESYAFINKPASAKSAVGCDQNEKEMS